MDLHVTALELGKMIKEKKIGVREALDEAYAAIDNGGLNAYTNLCPEFAYTQADAVQRGIDKGELTSPLAGVPMSVKANISTKGIETNCASKMLSGYIPVYDATAVKKLKDAGAVIIGKTNMDEFAMGGSTETSYFGTAKNPWDLKHVPGGSSGGAAAAVISGEGYYALASDTGGSIRQPCSFCSVTGIKPTYGAVSRNGLIAYASSLDQIGPIGRDINDCAEVLKTISGHDSYDATCAKLDFDIGHEVKNLRIGLPRQYFTSALEPEIAKKIYDAAKVFENLGARISEFDFSGDDMTDYTVSAYYIIACAEASSNLSRYDGIKYGYLKEGQGLVESYINTRSEGFGIVVKRRLMLGTFVLSSGFYDAYYKKALNMRNLLRAQWNRIFEEYDVVLGPVAPTTAYRIGENINDPMKMMLGDMYTVAVNMAYLPAAALPCGFDRNGLPIGMQLIGKAFGENTLINAARAFQQATDHHKKFPDADAVKTDRIQYDKGGKNNAI